MQGKGPKTGTGPAARRLWRRPFYMVSAVSAISAVEERCVHRFDRAE